MALNSFMLSFLFTNMLLRNTPKVSQETASRGAVIASLPMVVPRGSLAGPLVVASETRNQVVENQNLQATVRSKLDTDLLVAKLDQELQEEDENGNITGDEVNRVLRAGFDAGQLNLIIEAAKKEPKKNKLLEALGEQSDTTSSSIANEIARNISLMIDNASRQLMEQRSEGTQTEQQQYIKSAQSDEDKKKT
jgi:hypothetical protein